MEALDSHPQIRAEKELLAALRKKVKKGAADPASQVQCVQKLFAAGDYDYQVVGFKTKPKDILQRQELARVLQAAGTRVILLQRRNRIKLLVSLLNAVRLNVATGDWNLYHESDRQTMLKVDVSEFKAWLENVERHNSELNAYARGLHLPTLNLYYEDILVEEESSFRRVCDFLEVPYQELCGNCKKNTSDDLREVVANFDELKTSFSGTRYVTMFDEVMQLR